ncbi:3-dehydroquinate synthase [Prochlorococcus marinus]|uniref:3-dehydroquinate synthase n=1 Tax=Prochlorococcus marinus (strain MIT 9211) TaxID=93059 RepID=AROB_PROM4|nr:3-dehydroquinate synthase [Prochlorococcus marinus]A9BA66.1 RecName: Full=3-dehydroquinate synthase; Short=DHQS [Prochlorococcus marinus str. MIT 9211]ABX08728.1 3-dehydroquinate synthase [Prochlorococcus marinus str. MIT 9211]
MNQNSIRIKIKLAHNPYEVVIKKNGLARIGEELKKIGFKKATKVLVVTNKDVSVHYGKEFIHNLSDNGFNPTLIEIKAGEERKNLATISDIHNAAYTSRLERGSLMIALGGGVIGDMTGFAAATWLRGVSFVQVPTTLLAMVDASVGGKTGVNHPKGKNLIGAFHQPKLVLIDPITLKTLPEREFKAGMAEVIKYGVISDKKLFRKLEDAPRLDKLETLTDRFLLEIIQRSVQTKAHIVELDEREGGIRAVLNYGHTFGHAIEALCGYGTWLHGEAVSMGMIAIGQLALERNIWNISDLERQRKVLCQAGLPTIWPRVCAEDVIEILKSDKKVKDGEINFIVPTEIGKVEIIKNFTVNEIKQALQKLASK